MDQLFVAGASEEPLPGYSKPSLHQLMLCDKAPFTKLASTLPSVWPKKDGTYPLGITLLQVRPHALAVATLVAEKAKGKAKRERHPQCLRLCGTNGAEQAMVILYVLLTILVVVMVPVMGGVVPKVGICAPNLSASSPMCLAVTQRRHLDGVSKTGPIACSTSVS